MFENSFDHHFVDSELGERYYFCTQCNIVVYGSSENEISLYISSCNYQFIKLNVNRQIKLNISCIEMQIKNLLE